MLKHKYKFHADQLIFVKVRATLREKILLIIKYFLAILIVGFISYLVFPLFIDTPEVRKLKRENGELVQNFDIINKRLDQLKAVIEDLQKRDENIYRIIFEAEPISPYIREAGSGGVDRYEYLVNQENKQLIARTQKKLDFLTRKAYVQSRSFDEITVLAKRKDELVKGIPAIMPISNKDLTRVASSFGMRIHPFYKVLKMHTGMDFTAPTGTEVYATGDGVVSKIQYAQRGYGYHLVIDHGFGYQTLYAHLSKILVRPGQKVKRGTVIGLVGNTGTSVAPHLHYEVRRNDQPVNPINYYFNDLTPEEYDKLIKIASQPTQSFD
ncbi:MAG: M23 family metallopeptidase [Bacteroidales bacterium]|nr:M23 family metallopeptidase [Bacteroidales bacterium]HPD95201.1 M23 family metallopeptidase [Tenuifilaceae bacterium]HRX31477.1 M23 family metallopeptidase [Tenuifilaceae bacterium]